jgi:hypothetical protein
MLTLPLQEIEGQFVTREFRSRCDQPQIAFNTIVLRESLSPSCARVGEHECALLRVRKCF